MGKKSITPTSGWSKLDCGIVDSSLWVQEHDVLRVWIAMLAKADAYGQVRISRPALAHLCFIELERLEEILDYLSSPDEASRNKDFEGRRIEELEGGWVILNYEMWRNSLQNKPASGAERQRRYRQRNRNAASRDVTKSVTRYTEAEAEADTDAEGERERDAHSGTNERPHEERSFDEFWAAYPRKVGKKDARKAWKQTAKERPPTDKLISTLEALTRTRSWRKDGGAFIPYPATWLRRGGWDDEPAALETRDDSKTRFAGSKIPPEQYEQLREIGKKEGWLEE